MCTSISAVHISAQRRSYHTGVYACLCVLKHIHKSILFLPRPLPAGCLGAQKSDGSIPGGLIYMLAELLRRGGGILLVLEKIDKIKNEQGYRKKQRLSCAFGKHFFCKSLFLLRQSANLNNCDSLTCVL